MSNADRQVLAAIKRNPYPQDRALADMAGVVAGLLDTVDRQAERIRKLENLVETLIEQQLDAMAPRRLPPAPAHSTVLPGIRSGDGKTMFRCVCDWDSGWMAGNDGLDAMDGHIARELYGYVPDSAEAVNR